MPVFEKKKCLSLTIPIIASQFYVLGRLSLLDPIKQKYLVIWENKQFPFKISEELPEIKGKIKNESAKPQKVWGHP